MMNYVVGGVKVLLEVEEAGAEGLVKE